MYERFTDHARNVMLLANQEAQRFKHEYIGTEHILLGLVKEGSGVAVAALRNVGIEPNKITVETEKLIREGSEVDPNVKYPNVKYPQTPRARKVIEYAMEEAHTLKHDYVGTEHILLGLLREDKGVAAQVLMNLGLQLDKVRAEIQTILGSWSDPEDSSEFLYSSRTHWIMEYTTYPDEPPDACPKCRDPHTVRIIWHCVHLSEQDQKDIEAGTLILGSCSDMAGPPWVCLRCSPAWSDVHALAMQDYQLQLAKENAVALEDFETAIKHRDAQFDLKRQCSQIVEELLKNL